jgi:malonyl-CoA O-methyltransferase
MSRRERIKAAFHAAAGTYEQAAEAQDRTAEALAARIQALPWPAAPRVLEIGCGTGLLTRRLAALFPGGQLLATDIAPSMVEAAARAVPSAATRVMDGEAPDLPDGAFDLVASSLAAQWFADLPAALARLKRLLAPGGRLMIATAGADSLQEWRDAQRKAGAEPGTPDYPTAAQLSALGVAVTEQRIIVNHVDGTAFLRALKDIGAQTPRPGHKPLPPRRMKAALAALGSPAAITYHVLFASWEAEAK